MSVPAVGEPLSYAQKRLWTLDRLPHTETLAVPIAIGLGGVPVDRGALQDVLHALASRHEALRTRFPLVDGQPVRIVEAIPSVGPLPAQHESVDLCAAIARETARPFDLMAEPPWRAGIIDVPQHGPVLLLTVHAIVCDARSATVIRRDVQELREAQAQGRRPRLAELPTSYGAYVVRQRELLARAESAGRLAERRASLTGLPPLQLPTSRTHAAVHSPRADAITAALPADTLSETAKVARRHGVSTSTVLLSAFVGLLARYSGQSDFAVGSRVDGRADAGCEGMAGHFANTLVLGVNTTGAPVFDTLVDLVAAAERSARGAGDIPFEQLVESLETDGDHSRNLLSQAVFDHRVAGGTTTPSAGHDGGSVPDVPDFDLSLAVLTDPDTGQGTVQVRYAATKFDSAVMRHFAEHYSRLLTQAIAEPGRRLSDIDILTPVEHDTMLIGWNDTRTARPAAMVPELIARQAALTPDAVALDDGTTRLTYRDVQERSDLLAARLRYLGLAPEQVAGVCLERGHDLVTAFLAVWKAGGAYVPLDPALPASRLSYMLTDSRAELVITTGALLPALPSDSGIRRLVLDEAPESDAVDKQVCGDAPATDPDSLAYIIYTSGSTGSPKGVMISHRGLQNYLMWGIEGYARSGPAEGAPLFSSVAFDMVIPNLYVPLMIGHPVRLLPEKFDPAALGSLLVDTGPYSFIKLTPGHLDILTDQLTSEQATGLADLLAVGADSFPGTVLERWLALAGPNGPQLLNEYGPTEISVANSTYPITGPEGPGVLPIGRPIPNTTAYVLNEHAIPQPVGVPGELYIGGLGVARGYRNMPAVTAENFLPDTFSTAPGSRLYRTGDRASCRADGTIEFLGRIDDQVKVGGYRVEPAEVIGALVAHADVTDALVVADGDGAAARLVAYVVSRSAERFDADAMARHCASLLPAYLVPALFMSVDRIPLNANGKVDRSSLPAPVVPVNGPHLPSNELETTIESICRDLLGAEKPLDVSLPFFHLGGTSILAARLAARVGAEFGTTVPLRVVFEQPAIRDLAQFVAAQLRDEITHLTDEEVIALAGGEARGGR
ncbi:amino acid adenylation domain-containing protein [Streptomyces sp. NPDC051172]|uniref:non-ribosomal peptide synthetase n=1 Tax=Streptomyces sp. NPDC051172 TaxID=3155796 RepID=UPI0034341E6E